MKPGLITVLFVVLTSLLASCGQKGLLYREASTQSKAETEAASAKQTASDDER